MREHGWAPAVTRPDRAAKDRAPSPFPAESRQVPAHETPPYAATSRVRAADRSPPRDGGRDGGGSAGTSAAADGGGSPRAAALSDPGRPLDDDVAATLAPRVGFDPSGVRVHDDQAARRTAQQLGALAYTWGNHVGFAPGAYQPRTAKGHALLAHELAHVGQQLTGSTAPEQVQEAEADAVERGGSLALATTHGPPDRGPRPLVRPAPVLRLRPGDATSLTITVGDDGRASFSAEVEGGGTVTGTGTTTNLEPGEYQVRHTGGHMDITGPDGSIVPRTTRFDIGWSTANAALLRALTRAATAIPMHVASGPVPSGGGGGAAPDPESDEGRRQRLADLPEHIRNFLFTEGSGRTARPEDYAALLRIAASVADLSEAELAEFRARTTGGTTDVAEFEASVTRWLGEVRARRDVARDQEQATNALLGFDAIYDMYRAWLRAQAGMPGPPAELYAWESQPTSALPTDHPGSLMRAYLQLRRALQAQNIPNLAAFVAMIDRFVTAFRESAVHVAREMLDRYEHVLLEQQGRYATGSAGLHTALAPARATFRQAAVHYSAATAPNPHESMAADDRALAEAAEYARLAEQGRTEVRAQASAHPLLSAQDFPLEELGRAATEADTRTVLDEYITEHLEHVRSTRTRIHGDHELVYRLDVLVNSTMARQGIRPDSVWAKIIEDHNAPTIEDIERQLMVATLLVALGILTWGTGSVVLAGAGLLISGYQAIETYADYASRDDAYGAQLLSEEPSLAWVVLAVLAVAADMAAVAAVIRPIRPALQAFQRTGDLTALEAELAGVEIRIQRSIMARAELELRAQRGWRGLGLVPPGALRGSLGLELLAEAFGRLVYAAHINIQRGIRVFERWRLTQEAIDLVGDTGRLAPDELRAFAQMYTRAVDDAERIAIHGRRLGLTEEQIGDAMQGWAQRGTGTADDLIREMTAAHEASQVGRYTGRIRWGIQDVDVRPSPPGFWGRRTPQANPRVDAYELKINPNNESYFLPHPNGGFVQFENVAGAVLQDGKLIMQPRSIYHVADMPGFAEAQVLAEARRQVAAAQHAGLSVEWLVSEQRAIDQLNDLFRANNIPITARMLPE